MTIASLKQILLKDWRPMKDISIKTQLNLIYLVNPQPEQILQWKIYKCALCEKYYDNLEELTEYAYCHIAENLNPTDTTFQVWGHQF